MEESDVLKKKWGLEVVYITYFQKWLRKNERLKMKEKESDCKDPDETWDCASIMSVSVSLSLYRGS